MPLASELYINMLTQQAPRRSVELRFETIYPCADGFAPPSDAELADFDGCCFTGSSLSAYESGNADIDRQLELMERTFACGVSSFGSCWGLQVAAQALGGQVEPIGNRGREVGIGRKITMTAEGRGHPMFAGKKSVYEAFMSHGDEVTRVPPAGIVLSGNDHTRVQSMCVARAARRRTLRKHWHLHSRGLHPHSLLGACALLQCYDRASSRGSCSTIPNTTSTTSRGSLARARGA